MDERISDQAIVCQEFVMIGLGTALQLRNYHGHLFYSGVFKHNTAVPLFIYNGKV